ncbi:hypothetical protein A8U91_00262 [Halomonas elongata]|uniref:FecR N-terminal domain-containing protein n=1 Tax=Halomonas elongata TaxID=2746 RepID=A0A1B8P0Z0_HALEL|nr:DUF4880 domain-containing protein [Halomonas elongata]OBX35926.1 hypothetical protein A8U91_00262 [Halomonas elongata]
MTPSANDQAPDEAAADEAMQWYLRLKDDSATEEDQRAFQAWLDRDPRHARAYRDTEQLWQEIEAPARLMAARRNARSSRRLRPIRGGYGQRQPACWWRCSWWPAYGEIPG